MVSLCAPHPGQTITPAVLSCMCITSNQPCKSFLECMNFELGYPTSVWYKSPPSGSWCSSPSSSSHIWSGSTHELWLCIAQPDRQTDRRTITSSFYSMVARLCRDIVRIILHQLVLCRSVCIVCRYKKLLLSWSWYLVAGVRTMYLLFSVGG